MRTFRAENNNLIIRENNKDSRIYGTFEIDQDNNLGYRPAEALLKNVKMTFNGAWHLNPEHDLVFYINADSSQQILIKSTIIKTESNKIYFAVESPIDTTKSKITSLKLTGEWKTTNNGNIYFEVYREKKPGEKFNFLGIWSINKNLSLEYKYKKTELKTKTKKAHYFTIDGRWHIVSDKQLHYILEAGTNNYLSLAAAIETESIYAKTGKIRYKVMLGYVQTQTNIQKLVLSGAWKFSKKFEISFSTTYSDQKEYVQTFRADYNISSRDKIEASLKTHENKLTNLNIIFTRTFFDDSSLFLEYKQELGEYVIKAGYKRAW